MASAMAAASGLSEEVLERLASDPMSCVERVARYVRLLSLSSADTSWPDIVLITVLQLLNAYFTRTAHIALSPASLGNLKAGVAQYFSTHINRYHPALHGILLGYRCERTLRN